MHLLLVLARLAIVVVAVAPAADHTLLLPATKVAVEELDLQVAFLALTSPTNQMPSRTSLASMNTHAAQALVSQAGVMPK